MTDDYIGRLLKFDPLGKAERTTGESYKTDEATMSIGFAIALLHNQVKSAALEANHDTRYSIPWDEALNIFNDLGFEIIYQTVAQAFDGSDQAYILGWTPDGLFINADNYHGVLNSGKVHYNWQPVADLENRLAFMSSGRWHTDDVLVGDHPIVEGLRYNIGRMRANGTFLNPWKHQPFLWLNPHDEDDYKVSTNRIIAELPQHVQDAIKGESK